MSLTGVTRADRRAARLASLGASFRYACTLYVNGCHWPMDLAVLDQLEIEARLERLANDVLRRSR